MQHFSAQDKLIERHWPKIANLVPYSSRSLSVKTGMITAKTKTKTTMGIKR